MKVINAGLMLMVIAAASFATGSLRTERVERVLFDRILINVNMDTMTEDVLDAAIMGIDVFGEAVISHERAEEEYGLLVRNNFKTSAKDWTAFFVLAGNIKPDEKTFETEVSEQIKSVNKKLNYSFLFTEKTISFRYNPVCENSIYIMFLPKFSNIIRIGKHDVIYTLSGAKLN